MADILDHCSFVPNHVTRKALSWEGLSSNYLSLFCLIYFVAAVLQCNCGALFLFTFCSQYPQISEQKWCQTRSLIGLKLPTLIIPNWNMSRRNKKRCYQQRKVRWQALARICNLKAPLGFWASHIPWTFVLNQGQIQPGEGRGGQRGWVAKRLWIFWQK